MVCVYVCYVCHSCLQSALQRNGRIWKWNWTPARSTTAAAIITTTTTRRCHQVFFTMTLNFTFIVMCSVYPYHTILCDACVCTFVRRRAIEIILYLYTYLLLTYLCIIFLLKLYTARQRHSLPSLSYPSYIANIPWAESSLRSSVLSLKF